jgi:NAD(P)-dependent dehydrogenase (short-subunit alcohol dehydrogenase family)
MKILLVGASGTLGMAVRKELGNRHEIIAAGRSSGDVRVDLTDESSIKAMLDKIGTVDAIASTAGHVTFAPLAKLDAAAFAVGLNDKLMGQVNLVQQGVAHLVDGGSFTLIGGILSEHPIIAGASASMVNAALEGFVRAAAIELPRGIRINVVSPTVLVESMDQYGPFFRGFEPAPAFRVGLAYSRSIEGAGTGQVLKVY